MWPRSHTLGGRGRRLNTYRDINATPLGGSGGQDQRPFYRTVPGPRSHHPGDERRQVLVRQRSTLVSSESLAGLNTQYNLTLARCEDFVSVDRRSRSSFLQASNPYDSENNRGPCDYDVRANLSLGAVFELPDLGAGRVGSGWQMATSSPRSAAGRSRRASATAIDRVRASAPFGPIAHGEIEDEPRDPDRYVANASTAFSDPAPGTLGTCGRSSGRLPGFAQWDLSVLKNVTVKNDIRVQFRWEIFNVLNRANFGVLQSTNVRSGIFGTIGSTPDVDAANPVMSQARGRCNGP